jgi:hypothetical protein
MELHKSGNSAKQVDISDHESFSLREFVKQDFGF